MRSIRPSVFQRWALITVGILLLTGCAASPETANTTAPQGYPVTVENCGAEVTFEAPPERLVLLKSAPVPALHALGVLDRAVARAGAFPEEYFDEPTLEELEAIPQLTSDVDATGHLHISKDIVIAQNPDVVFGEVENLPRQSLAASAIPLLEEPALCATGADQSPDFEAVYHQVEAYGTVFNKQAAARTIVEDLEDRVAAARAQTPADEQRTAAVLYPTVGGGTTYAYGTGSMAHAQLEAAGLTNVFAGTSERVFEVSSEQLLGYDPDIIILLHSEGDPQAVEESLHSLPGAETLTAVQKDQVMTQLLNFAEPATPLAVTGLENIVERFHT